MADNSVFQSTPPVKAATVADGIPANFDDISIHAAREGGDRRDRCNKHRRNLFQSTPPVKAATDIQIFAVHRVGISIHAAREGGDVAVRMESIRLYHFNPRRP